MIGNNYRGPRKNRVLKNTGYAQFVDTDARDAFLKAAEGRAFTLQDKAVALKPGLPHWFRHRNYILSEAKKQLMAHNGNTATGLVYERVDKVRTLKLHGVLAFQQLETDKEGSFQVGFEHLRVGA